MCACVQYVCVCMHACMRPYVRVYNMRRPWRSIHPIVCKISTYHCHKALTNKPPSSRSYWVNITSQGQYTQPGAIYQPRGSTTSQGQYKQPGAVQPARDVLAAAACGRGETSPIMLSRAMVQFLCACRSQASRVDSERQKERDGGETGRGGERDRGGVRKRLSAVKGPTSGQHRGRWLNNSYYYEKNSQYRAHS